MSARRCGRPHLYNVVCSASVFWLLPCDVRYRECPRPDRRGRGPGSGRLRKGGPSLPGFFWSKPSKGRTPLSRLTLFEMRIGPSSLLHYLLLVHGQPDGLSAKRRPFVSFGVSCCVESTFGIPAVDPELPAPSLGSHLGRCGLTQPDRLDRQTKWVAEICQANSGRETYHHPAECLRFVDDAIPKAYHINKRAAIAVHTSH